MNWIALNAIQRFYKLLSLRFRIFSFLSTTIFVSLTHYMCRQSQQHSVVRAATQHAHTRTHTHTRSMWKCAGTRSHTHIHNRRKTLQTHNIEHETWEKGEQTKRWSSSREKRKPVCLRLCVVSMWLWFRPFTVWIEDKRFLTRAQWRDTSKSFSVSLMSLCTWHIS